MRQRNQFSQNAYGNSDKLRVKSEPQDEDVVFLGFRQASREPMQKQVKFEINSRSPWEGRRQADNRTPWEGRNPVDNRSPYEGRRQEDNRSYQDNYSYPQQEYDYHKQEPVKKIRYDENSYQMRPQIPYQEHEYYPQPVQAQQPIYQQPPQYPQYQESKIEKMFQDYVREKFMNPFMEQMMRGELGLQQNYNSEGGRNQPQQTVRQPEPVVEEEVPAEVDEAEIKNMEHRVEVIPKNCKINRFKFMVQKAPYQSKILVFVDGKKTMDFLQERLGSTIDGYELVNINDYRPDPEIGQLIMLTDRDVEDRSKFKEVHIGFNYAEPKEMDQYLNRMALYSGKGKKYSISYVTNFQENKLGVFKEINSKFGFNAFPESFDKLDQCVQNSGSDDDKKAIYDESFNKIKEEKYTFKLPRGTKKNPQPKASNEQPAQGGGSGWGGNQASASGGGGWGGNQAAATTGGDSGWGGNQATSTTGGDGGWGGNQPAQQQQPQDEGWGGASNNQAEQKAVAEEGGW